MEATTILVIVLCALFLGGMGTLVFIANTPPRKKKGEAADGKEAAPR